MVKYKFIKEPDNQYDTTKVTFESESVTLTDLLLDFKLFLLASGFVFDGEVKVCNDELEIKE